MLAQNLLQGGILNLTAARNGPGKTENPRRENTGNSPFQFRDILDTSMARARQANDLKNTSRSVDNGNQSAVQAGQGLTYRDIASVSRRQTGDDVQGSESLKETDSTVGIEAVSGTEKNEDQGQLQVTREDAVQECLAQALGINVNDLKTLLGFLKIKPEELADPSKAGEMAQKLASLIGLDQGQEKTLEKLLVAVTRKVDTLFGDRHAIPAAKVQSRDAYGEKQPEKVETSGWIETDIPDIEVIEKPDPAAGFASVLKTMKEKLELLAAKLGKELPNSEQEISGELEEFLNKLVKPSEEERPKPQVKAEAIEPAAPENSEPENSAKKVQSAKENQKEVPDDNSKSATVPKAPQLKTEVNNQNVVQNTVQSTVQQIKTETAAAVKPEKIEVPVEKSQIISQVVEKAKVILSGEKSEMVMDLKPDSLGKLSLKVVTENGLVMAKFEAESQQVKQVIETNMQLLKDSLEKQGLMVQGFSVSVRDNGSGARQNGYSLSGGRREEKAINLTVPGIVTSEMPGLRSANPYQISESSIDLTA